MDEEMENFNRLIKNSKKRKQIEIIELISTINGMTDSLEGLNG